eukprot:CAMPEP_0178748082 /NCGR_PEP_ID=MMETSP0744-20121128/8694_1 /TAXON_ID=913974 /ORGANISM="Nitzschia punctata, Strain CCMP561" /LENGTH=392 /DNA_ID=CAMNT_0020401419 /DNA_START=210 /DNA_END=1388 /DNA_ORIENTATION=+
MDFSNEHDKFPAVLWGTTVTRKCVDSVTFCLGCNVSSRIEDSSYETTDLAISRPLFDSSALTWKRNKTNDKDEEETTTPMSPRSQQATARAKIMSKKSPTKRSTTKSSGKNNLGAFLQKNTVEQIKQEAAAAAAGIAVADDTHSLGSKSMSSRSVSDRSHAERSKAEESLARKAKERRSHRGNGSINASNGNGSNNDDQSIAMQSIDELNAADFNESSPTRNTNKSPVRTKGTLGFFLKQNAIDEKAEEDGAQNEEDRLDTKSVTSASTLGSKSFSALSRAEQSDSEKKLREKRKETEIDETSSMERKPSTSQTVTTTTEAIREELEASLNLEDVRPTEKKLRFRDGDSEKYISQELTNSMYDDLFYTSEELADFRYEAFLEEAGLDVNEFM